MAEWNGADGRVSFAQYWYIDDTTDSFVELKNHLGSPLVVVPSIIRPDRDPIELDPVTIQPLATLRLSLKDRLSRLLPPDPPELLRPATTRWGDGSRPNSFVGACRLVPIHPRSAGADDFTAWTIIESPAEGILLVHPFKPSSYVTSSILDSVWWRPFPSASVYYALQNLQATALEVQVEVFDEQGRPAYADTLRLAPSGFELLALGDLAPALDADVGGVRFSLTESRAGALMARGMLIDESKGFSSPLYLHEYDAALSDDTATELHAVSLLFGDLSRLLPNSRATVHPHLMLRNVTDEPVALNWEIAGKNADGRAARMALPERVLAPRTSVHVDLYVERARAGSNIADGVGSLALSHSAHPMDILAELLNVDETGDLCLYDKVVNLHAYEAADLTVASFSVREDRRTFLVVKNVTDSPQRARILVDYDDGAGTYERSIEVESGDLAVVDLAQWRDQGVPDRDGARLPSGDLFGGCVIAADEPGTFIASDPTFTDLLRPDPTTGATIGRAASDGFSCVAEPGGGPGGGGTGGGGTGGGPKSYARSPFESAGCRQSKGCTTKHTGRDLYFPGIALFDHVVSMEEGTVTGIQLGNPHCDKPDPDCSPNGVIVRGRDGGYTVYLHVRPSDDLKKGQKVRPGDVIGWVDDSGYTTGPHIHVARLRSGFGKTHGGDFRDFRQEADDFDTCEFRIPSCPRR